jgi:hypothetical protein
MAEKIRGAVSVDTDPLDSFCQNLTGNKISEHDITYLKILPRYLDFFKRKRIKATFFIIGSRIKSQYHSEILKRIVDEGHEIGNHTFSHLLGFSRLSACMKEKEIARCEEAIKKATGTKPAGFRAPGWDIDRQTMAMLEKRGYVYDSSVFPTLFNPLSLFWLSINAKSSKDYRAMVNFRTSFAPLSPYHPDAKNICIKGNSRIIESPANATPFLRIPFYGTFLFMSKSKMLFDCSLKALALSKIPLNYALHSVELYDRDNDLEDAGIKPIGHPSIRESLKNKMKMYDYIFGRFDERYKISSIRDLASSYNP